MTDTPPVVTTVRAADADAVAEDAVASFLRSIGAGAGASAPTTTTTKDASAPGLPLSAQLSLLDAQVDAVRQSLEEALQKHRVHVEERRRQTRRVRARAKRMAAQVADWETRLAKQQAEDGTAALLAEYEAASRQRKEDEVLLSALRDALLPAAESLEALEDAIEQGRVSHAAWEPMYRRAAAACAVLGGGGGGLGGGGTEGGRDTTASTSASRQHQWLMGAGTGASPAPSAWQLARRLRTAEERAEEMVMAAWREAVYMGRTTETARTSGLVLRLSDRVDVGKGSITMAELLESLHHRGKLSGLLQRLGHDLRSRLLEPLLVPLSSERAPYHAVASGNETHFSRASSERGTTSLGAVEAALGLLERSLLSKLPGGVDAEIRQLRRFLAVAVVALLPPHLRSALPAPSADPWSPACVEALASLRRSAQSLYASLERLGHLTDAEMRDEADEATLGWCRHVGNHYARSLADAVRAEARSLLLPAGSGADADDDVGLVAKLRSGSTAAASEGGGAGLAAAAAADGWTPVVIELEAEVDLLKLSGVESADAAAPGADVAGEADDWGWQEPEGDDQHQQPKSPPPLRSGRSRGQDASGGAAAAVAASSARSDATAPLSRSSSGSRIDSPARRGAGSKRAALGSVRIVKPRQPVVESSPSGSAPADGRAEEEKAKVDAGEAAEVDAMLTDDAVAWGLDEEATTTNTTNIAAGTKGPATGVGVADAGVLEDIDDDAWGLSSEEVAARRASRLLTQEETTSKGETAAPEAQDESDEGNNAPVAGDEAEEADNASDDWGLGVEEPTETKAVAAPSEAPPAAEEPKQEEETTSAEKLQAKADAEPDPWAEDLDLAEAEVTQSTQQDSEPEAQVRDQKADEAPLAKEQDDPDAAWGWDDDGVAIPEQAVPPVSKESNPRAASGTDKDAREDAPAPPATDKKPTELCAISQRSLDVVALIQRTLQQASQLSQAVQGGDGGGGGGADAVSLGASDASELAKCAADVVDELRALMPVAHAATLRQVPALAMQFVNDCTYLARELERMQKGAGGGHGVEALQGSAALVTALGRRVFEEQMAQQEDAIDATLDATRGFTRTYEEPRRAACASALDDVVSLLRQLAQAWRATLGLSTLLATLGRLAEHAVSRVVGDVIALDDIAEVESEALAQLVKRLAALEELFVDPASGKTAVALFVPSWFKASYLSEILGGSLKDIEWLLDTGALLDYSARELDALVRALFADTPKRQRLLQRIVASASAPPGGF